MLVIGLLGDLSKKGFHGLTIQPHVAFWTSLGADTWRKWEDQAEFSSPKVNGNFDWKGWSAGNSRISRTEETIRLIL